MNQKTNKKFNLLQTDQPLLKACIEGILFISEQPVKSREIADALGIEPGEAKEIIENLKQEYIDSGRGFILRKVAGGYRFYSNPAISDYIKDFVKSNIRSHLSQAALETLAITAYKQPVTRTQIAEIRGVRTDSVVVTLVEKGLLKEAGKLKEPGNPIIYRTTEKFLELMGIDSLSQLPPLDSIDSE
ncbi:MAG: SMC-Scp complex subunit ScpB [Actinomycetia bacterium]|nr:SMC-Scp complex subunit ScpB [Actinomycetes bacterium]